MSPNTNGEGVCVHARIACGIFHVSGEVGHFDHCRGCQEPSKQQIMREEKQRLDAEGVKAAKTRLILPAPLLPVPDQRDVSWASLAEGTVFFRSRVLHV